MPGLDRGLVELQLPIKPGKKPIKQNPRRFAPEILSKIKTEVERLLKCKFIRVTRYVEWIANIVHPIEFSRMVKYMISGLPSTGGIKIGGSSKYSLILSKET